MHNYLFHKQQDQENYCYSAVVNTKTETFAFAGNKNAKHITEQILLIIITIIIITTTIIIIGDNAAQRQMARFRGKLNTVNLASVQLKTHTPSTCDPFAFFTPPRVKGQPPPRGSCPSVWEDNQLPEDWSPPSCPRSFPLLQINEVSRPPTTTHATPPLHHKFECKTSSTSTGLNT